MFMKFYLQDTDDSGRKEKFFLGLGSLKYTRQPLTITYRPEKINTHAFLLLPGMEAIAQTVI